MNNLISESNSSTSACAGTQDRLRQAFDLCVAKTRENIRILADSPRTSYAFDKDGEYGRWPEGFFEIGNWTTSFFTGMALLSWEATGDVHFIRQLNRLYGVYADKVTREAGNTMHDIGFLYSLYSVGLWRLIGSMEQRDLALKAAQELSKRYVPNGGYIRAWGRMDDNRDDYAGLAIVDCMMNLPLLFWATQETGNRFFHEIAVKHADTTLACFVRADASVCHAFRFDIQSGKPLGEDNYCGAAIGSHWARGTAWAVYGFAMAYRYTRNSRYLDVSKRMADRFLDLLDQEIVPPWDFRLKTEVRDSSAAAIAVCGLQELASLDSDGARYLPAADRLLARLVEAYVNFDIQVHGVLSGAEVGDGMDKDKNVKAKKVFASWGDYFLMEALARKLRNQKTYW